MTTTSDSGGSWVVAAAGAAAAAMTDAARGRRQSWDCGWCVVGGRRLLLMGVAAGDVQREASAAVWRALAETRNLKARGLLSGTARLAVLQQRPVDTFIAVAMYEPVLVRVRLLN